MATKKSFGEYAHSPCVKIVVGGEDDQQIFHVQKSLLEDKSGFFRACFRSKLSEALRDEVKLHADKAEDFGSFVNWIYGDIICIEAMDGPQLIKLYALSDKLMCHDLCNAIVDLTRRWYRTNWFVLSDFQLVMELGIQNTTFGQYLIQQLAFDVNQNFEDETMGVDWDEFLTLGSKLTQMVIHELVEMKQEATDGELEDPAHAEECMWHVHNTRNEEQQCKGLPDEDEE